MNFRAIPHTSTKKSPAELLFGRKFSTHLPDRKEDPAGHRHDLQEAKIADIQAKEKMKKDNDRNRNVRVHNVVQGDLSLLKHKRTKHKSCYNPDPYLVVQVMGSQIESLRGGQSKT